MWRILLVPIALLPLMGCGSKRTQGGVISGTITYKGQPLGGVLLRFYPQSDSKGGDIPVPVTPEGTFRTANITPGDYKVVVESQAPQTRSRPPLPANASEETKQKYQQVYGQDKPAVAFPDKYKRVSSTDLKCTVKEGEQKLPPLELK